MTDAEILQKYGEPPSGYASHREWIARCRRIELLNAVLPGAETVNHLPPPASGAEPCNPIV